MENHNNNINNKNNDDNIYIFGCRWFRVSDSKALYPVPSSHRVIPSQTLLLIKNADERADGRWVSLFLIYIYVPIHMRLA